MRIARGRVGRFSKRIASRDLVRTPPHPAALRAAALPFQRRDYDFAGIGNTGSAVANSFGKITSIRLTPPEDMELTLARDLFSRRWRDAIDPLQAGLAVVPVRAQGLAISIAGGFLFLRYSLAKFFRFWLLRQVYEQRAAIHEASAARSE